MDKKNKDLQPETVENTVDVITEPAAVEETPVVPETVSAEEDLHGENLGDRVKSLSPGMTVLKRSFLS